MPRFRSILAILLLSLGLAGCGNTYDIYYRLTVAVDVNGSEYIGSGVMRLHVRQDKLIPDGIGGGVHFDFSREAVVVDLGQRGVLFAVSRGGRAYDGVPTQVMIRSGMVKLDGSLPDTGARWEKKYRDFERARGVVALLPDEYPMLVSFRDINDPATVELVDPADLAAAFGAGVQLQRIMIEMIDAQPVTRGVEKWLPWLPGRKYITGNFGGSIRFFENEPAKNFTGVEFHSEPYP